MPQNGACGNGEAPVGRGVWQAGNIPCGPADLALRGRSAKASWRSGYAADCKSRDFASGINPQDDFRYQDIPRTGREHDNLSRAAAHVAGAFVLALEDPTEEALELLQRRAREALTAEHRRALADAFRGFLSDDATIYEPPPPAWCGTMGEARRWAEAAHESYRKAVALAAFQAMRPDNRERFLEHVQPRRVAA